MATKPEIKFDGGVVKVNHMIVVDGNGNGKPAGSLAVQLELNAAEMIQEIAKKDMPWLEALLGQIKV